MYCIFNKPIILDDLPCNIIIYNTREDIDELNEKFIAYQEDRNKYHIYSNIRPKEEAQQQYYLFYKSHSISSLFKITQYFLGKGTCSKVYLGCYRVDKTLKVAIKKVANKYEELFDRESSVLNSFPYHSNIIRYICSVKKGCSKYIVLEYFNKTTLYDLKGKLRQSELISITKQIIEGFRHLHRHNVVHRDIKPSNILYFEGKIKIIDFGFSVNSENEEHYSLVSPYYSAPELITDLREERNLDELKKTDVFSLGMSLYEIWMGEHILDKERPKITLLKDLKRFYLYGNKDLENFPVDTGFSLFDDLLKKLLNYKAHQRPDMEEINNIINTCF